MSFHLETWRVTASERLRNWRSRMQLAGVDSVYAFLSAATLWPVVEKAQAGDWSALAALGGVLAGVGSNLLANQIQSWKDEADAAQQIAADTVPESSLRVELDTVLQQLETFTLARQALPETERAWFGETLRAELARQGNLARFEAHLTGSGAIAQGEASQAAGAGGTLIGRDIGGDYLGPGATKIVQVPRPPARNQEADARRNYLFRLRRSCQALPLAALGGEEGANEDLTLDRVYIELDTSTPVSLTEAEQPPRRDHPRRPGSRDEQTRPLTAMEAATQASRLALLGEPGAGKSTFVRQLLAWLPAAQLGEAQPPPGLPSNLLPILVTLRDLAPRLAGLELSVLADAERRSTLAAAVREQALADLDRLEARDFARGLRQALTTGHCLLVLDGLDEVPHDLRRLIRGATGAVIGEYAIQRVILTCRVRSYVGEAVLPDFQAHTLAPFDARKVGDFARAWYNARKPWGGWTPSRQNARPPTWRKRRLRASSANSQRTR